MWRVIRIDKIKVAKIIFESKLESTRQARKLKLRMLEDVKNYLRERKLKRWRQQTKHIVSIKEGGLSNNIIYSGNLNIDTGLTLCTRLIPQYMCGEFVLIKVVTG
jgi:hypothetical protein